MTNYKKSKASDKEKETQAPANEPKQFTGQPPTTPYKLTDKDFRQINLRSILFFQFGWNYERMQGSGYLYTILPQLRKIYGDDTPELYAMMKTHAQFFNTSNFFNTIITGIDIAMEEKEQIVAKESVKGLKVGLMGPFAAVGDAIFASLVPTIFGAIAANMAQDGNPFGAILWFVAILAILVFRWKQLKFAYKEGGIPRYDDATSIRIIDQCSYTPWCLHGRGPCRHDDTCEICMGTTNWGLIS
nr:PTS system mannose/fructose/sorbose family transporter subunit IID [Staphylococcus auricularis]